MKTILRKAIRWVAAVGIGFVGLTAQAGITYFHNDIAGSPVAATNESGQVIWRESYRPYGERRINSAAASGNKVWFTSRRQDAETGLLYMGARYYDPVVGRFISTDPVGFDEQNVHSFNRYAYANNNPFRYVDPDGRSPLSLFLVEVVKQTGAGFALGVAADSVSQYAAWGTVDLGMAATSNAAIAGGTSGLLAGAIGGTAKALEAAQAARVAGSLADDSARAIPVGSSRSPMDVEGAQNLATTIGGRQYTGHALDKMQGRGITPSVVEDTIARGTQSAGRDGATLYTTDQARVILNPSGSVKTVYPQ